MPAYHSASGSTNPFTRFEDMQMLRHTKTLGIVQIDEAVWKRLSKDEKTEITQIYDEKLTQYFSQYFSRIK